MVVEALDAHRHSVVVGGVCGHLVPNEGGRPLPGTGLGAQLAFPRSRREATLGERHPGSWNAQPHRALTGESLEGDPLHVRVVPVEGLSRHLDRSVERALPPHSELVRGVVPRSEAGEAFRLVEGRFDPAGLDVASLRVFLVLDGDQIVTARTHAVRGGRLADLTRGFRTLVPLDLVPEAPRQVGLLLSDAVNETYTDRIAIPGHAGTPECERCNVVLVTFDALRADHLGSIRASAHGMTPHLDAFGRESVVFTHALAQSASTVVSLPSLFTSKFPYLDDAYAPLGLRPGQRTLTHPLADAGYSTAAVVGWR